MAKEQRNAGAGTALDRKQGTKIQQPPLYKVLLHNDDFTPRDFVVVVLVEVFMLGEGEAQSVMYHAHTNGFAVVGIFTHEIAESKVKRAEAMALEAQLPLRFTLESE